VPIDDEELAGLAATQAWCEHPPASATPTTVLGTALTALRQAVSFLHRALMFVVVLRRICLAIHQSIRPEQRRDGSTAWIVVDLDLRDWALEQIGHLFATGQLSPHHRIPPNH
jgi:hypothetical protein